MRKRQINLRENSMLQFLDGYDLPVYDSLYSKAVTNTFSVLGLCRTFDMFPPVGGIMKHCFGVGNFSDIPIFQTNLQAMAITWGNDRFQWVSLPTISLCRCKFSYFLPAQLRRSQKSAARLKNSSVFSIRQWHRFTVCLWYFAPLCLLLKRTGPEVNKKMWTYPWIFTYFSGPRV